MRKFLCVLFMVMFAASAVFAASTITITGDNKENLDIAYDGSETNTINQIWGAFDTAYGDTDAPTWSQTNWNRAGGIITSLNVTGPLGTADIWKVIAALAGNQLSKGSPLTITTTAAIPSGVLDLGAKVDEVSWGQMTWGGVWGGLKEREHDLTITLDGAAAGGANASTLAEIFAGSGTAANAIPLKQINLKGAELAIPENFDVDELNADAGSTVDLSGVSDLGKLANVKFKTFAAGATIVVPDAASAGDVADALSSMFGGDGAVPKKLAIERPDGTDISDGVYDNLNSGGGGGSGCNAADLGMFAVLAVPFFFKKSK